MGSFPDPKWQTQDMGAINQAAELETDYVDPWKPIATKVRMQRIGGVLNGLTTTLPVIAPPGDLSWQWAQLIVTNIPITPQRPAGWPQRDTDGYLDTTDTAHWKIWYPPGGAPNRFDDGPQRTMALFNNANNHFVFTCTVALIGINTTWGNGKVHIYDGFSWETNTFEY